MLFFGEKVKGTTDPDKKAMQVKRHFSLFKWWISAFLHLNFQERQFATMKSCIGELEAAVKKGKQEEVGAAQQKLLAEGTILLKRFQCFLWCSIWCYLLCSPFCSLWCSLYCSLTCSLWYNSLTLILTNFCLLCLNLNLKARTWSRTGWIFPWEARSPTTPYLSRCQDIGRESSTKICRFQDQSFIERFSFVIWSTKIYAGFRTRLFL